MTHQLRLASVAALCTTIVAGWLLVAAPVERATAYTGEARSVARAAHTLNATDTAHLHYVSASGSLLLDEGKATGALPGSMRVHLNLGTTFTGSFAIYTSAGSIKGHGSATPHGSGLYESFAGTLTVTGGTGRYSGAHGHGNLYGTFNRSNYALLIKTTGSLTY
jgi:hypothetical protein